jgi:acid stress chaperone HdeB
VNIVTVFRQLSRQLFVLAFTAMVIATWSLPAKAQVVLEMSMITCGQYLNQVRDKQDEIAAWLSGYFNAARGQSSVNLGNFQRNKEIVERYCKRHRAETLMSAIQRNAK